MKKQKITSLDARKQCRDKIHIWFNSADNYYHPVREVIQNAVDEIKNNFPEGIIKVKLHNDNRTITVTDTGRGMPLPEKDDEGVPYWQLLFLTLFAGGKYENGETEDETGGTNGVGNTVTCYTSDYFCCEAFYEGKHYKISFEDGGSIKQQLTTIGDTDKHGTSITFRLSNEVYTNTEFDEFEIFEIIRRFNGVTETIKYEFEYNDKIEILEPITLEQYFDSINQEGLTSGKYVGYEKQFTENNEKNKMSLIFATSSEPQQESFLNYVFLRDGGEINNGIIDGFRLFLNNYVKENKIKINGVISNKDVEDSLSFVCKFQSTKVSYSNQTKFSTGKKLYRKLAKEYTLEILEIFKLEQEQDLKKLLTHILEIQKFNVKSKESVKKIKKQLTEKVDNIRFTDKKFSDCKFHGSESELYVCEGLSAMGSIVLSRDAKYQAAMAMKGKIMNCLKAGYEEILDSKVIVNLIKVMGCGIESKKNKDLDIFDINKLRYGKIIIACDADEDGKQIVCLLLTMFYRLTPKLIENGFIYIVKTPLYENKFADDGVVYTFSEDEQDETVKKYGNEIKNIARMKGLGELDPEFMAEVGVDPKTRFIEKVTIESFEKMKLAFERWMGPSSLYRKNFLQKHLGKYLEEVL